MKVDIIPKENTYQESLSGALKELRGMDHALEVIQFFFWVCGGRWGSSTNGSRPQMPLPWKCCLGPPGTWLVWLQDSLRGERGVELSNGLLLLAVDEDVIFRLLGMRLGAWFLHFSPGGSYFLLCCLLGHDNLLLLGILGFSNLFLFGLPGIKGLISFLGHLLGSGLLLIASFQASSLFVSDSFSTSRLGAKTYLISWFSAKTKVVGVRCYKH